MALELESQSEPELQPAKRRRRLRPLFKDGEEFEAPWAANQVALVATPSKEASAGREEAVAGSALEQPALLTDNRVSAAAAAAAPKAAVKGAARAEAADKAAARAEAKTAAKAVAQAEAAAKAAARAAAKAAAKAAAQAEAAAKAAARAEAKAKVKSKTQAKAKQVRKSGRAKLGTDATNPASGLSGAAVAEDNVAAEAAETPEVQGNEEKAADLAPEASVARTNASEEVNVAQDSPTLETIRAASDEKEDTGDHERFNRESESCAGGAALAQLYSDCASEGKPSETMGVAMEEDATVSINSALKAAEPLHTQAKNSASIEPDANESSFGGSMHIAGTIGQLSAHIAETNQAGSGGPQTSETHLVTLSKAVHTAKEFGKDALFDSLFPDLKQYKDTSGDNFQVDAAPPPPERQLPGSYTLTVPENRKTVDEVCLQAADGRQMSAIVPEGKTAGDTFQVQPPVPFSKRLKSLYWEIDVD